MIGENNQLPNPDLQESISVAQRAITSNNKIDKVRGYELLINALLLLGRCSEALDIAKLCLKLQNINLEPLPPNPETIQIEQIDPVNQALWNIVKMAGEAAFVVSNVDWVLLSQFGQLTYHYRYGPGQLSSNALISYALYHISNGSIEDSYKLGKQAIDLLTYPGTETNWATVVEMFNGHIRLWKEHIRESIPALEEAHQHGILSGESMFSGVAALVCCDIRFAAGQNLPSIVSEYDRYLATFESKNNVYPIPYALIGKGLLQGLVGIKSGTKIPTFEELKQQQNYPAVWHHLISELILEYLLSGDLMAAANKAKEAESYQQAAAGMITLALHNFFYSLTLLAQYPNTSVGDRNNKLNQVAINQEKMAKWAQHAPMNFQHKYNLVAAEVARVKKTYRRAIMLYGQAILAARKYEYLQDRALANELAGRCCLEQDNQTMAADYLREAHRCYATWGAIAKLDDLEERYPLLVGKNRVVAAEPVGRAFSLSIEQRFLASLGDDLKSLLATGIRYRYEPASQTLVLIPVSAEVEAAVKTVLRDLQAASPADIRIRIQLGHWD